MKFSRAWFVGVVLLALGIAGTIRANNIFFDNFNQFPPGTVLSQTNYTPNLGASVSVNTNQQNNENSTTAVATNFLNNTWLLFNPGTAPYAAEYVGTPTVTPISQVVTESFELWIPATKGVNSVGGLGVNVLSTNIDDSDNGVTNFQDQPIVFFDDSGEIVTFSNEPSPQTIVQIGDWSPWVGKAMTNMLVLNYTAGTFSFSVNGVLQTNMPIPGYITSLYDAARLMVSEDIGSPSPGNAFAVGNISVSTPTAVTNQDVAFYVTAAKGQLYNQTGPGTVALMSTGFVFLTQVNGTGSNTVLGAADRIPGGSNLVLSLEDPSSSSYKSKTLFGSKAALDAVYASGSYTLSIFSADDGTLSSALTLPADDYPSTPQLANYDAAQAIGTSTNFTLVWGSFTNGSTNDAISLEIDDSMGGTITNTPDVGQPGQLDGTATSLVIPAGTLAPGESYTGYLEFIKVGGRNTNSVPGALGLTGYTEETQFGLMAGGTTVCTYAISPTNATFNGLGGSSSVNVTAPVGCPWTATNNDSFITITSGASGSGDGTVMYSVAENTGSNAITGTMTIAGQTFTVMESFVCIFHLDSFSASFPDTGGASNVTLTINSTNCNWNATSNNGFITLTGPTNGAGSSVISYTVAANGTTVPMDGSIVVAGITYPIDEAAVPCSVSPATTSAAFPSTGGASNIVINANGTNCAWMAASNSGFITITSGPSGTGNGAVDYTVAANSNAVIQTGTMTVAGQTFTVTEAAAPCSASPATTSATFPDTGGASNVIVNANGTNCAWSAVSNSGFIVLTGATNGVGSGVVSYSVAANTGLEDTNGTMTVAGETFTVTVDGTAPGCTFTLTPSSAKAGAGKSTRTVAVKTRGTNCVWMAASNNAFITVTKGSSGTNKGSVFLSIASNPDAEARTGTVSIADETFTVAQAAAKCSFTLETNVVAFGAAGGSSNVMVTANGGACEWKVVNSQKFITVTSTNVFSGDGTVAYTVESNATAKARTGTMTIAGKPYKVIQAAP